MSDFKAVLFDYDDTLVDTYAARLESAKKAVEGELDPGLDMDKIMRESAGRSQYLVFSDLAENDVAKADRMNTTYNDYYWSVATNMVRIFPDIMEALNDIKSKGLGIALVTSKIRSDKDSKGRRIGVELELARLGLMELFDVVVGRADTTENKPHPAPILFAVDKLGMGIDDVIMIGDSHIDIRASKNAKVKSGGAGWGTLDRALLEEVAPDYIFETPADILPIVS